MGTKKKMLLIASVSLLVLFYGLITSIAIIRINAWRIEEAEKYLSEAKKTQDSSAKLGLSEKAILLHPSEAAYLVAGSAALELNDGQLAEKYLANVKSGEGLFDLGRAELKLGKLAQARNSLSSSYALLKNEETARLLYLAGGNGEDTRVSRETNPSNRTSLIYNELITLGYPQAAIQTLKEGAPKGQLGRNSLITLAESEISEGNYHGAYDDLIRAKGMDPYYPQVYQQLIIVTEKLGQESEARQYQSFLDSITF